MAITTSEVQKSLLLHCEWREYLCSMNECLPALVGRRDVNAIVAFYMQHIQNMYSVYTKLNQLFDSFNRERIDSMGCCGFFSSGSVLQFDDRRAIKKIVYNKQALSLLEEQRKLIDPYVVACDHWISPCLNSDQLLFQLTLRGRRTISVVFSVSDENETRQNLNNFQTEMKTIINAIVLCQYFIPSDNLEKNKVGNFIQSSHRCFQKNSLNPLEPPHHVLDVPSNFPR